MQLNQCNDIFLIHYVFITDILEHKGSKYYIEISNYIQDSDFVKFSEKDVIYPNIMKYDSHNPWWYNFNI